MIDMHSHIISNIDDGAKSVEETFELIKEAQEVGFKAIILTSHYMEGYYETNVPERKIWINAIYQKLQEQNIDIKLYLGNEIYFSENIIALLKERKASTINDTNYVLFELPLSVEPMNLYDGIYEMQQHQLVPILAHPERYSYIQKEPTLVNELIEKGVLMQANFTSILGEYGNKAQLLVKKLLKNKMVHFLGSDVHKQKTIYPKISKALKEIETIIGPEKLKELTTINPKFVLENKRIDIDMPRRN